MPILIRMPNLGLTTTTGRVTEWLRDEGAEVAADEPLLVVESEKTISDIPAPASGILRRIVAKVGDVVPTHGAVAVVTTPGDPMLSEQALDDLIATANSPRSGDAPGVDSQVHEELIALPDGRQLFAISAGRITEAPPLVFLHGLGGSRTSWETTLPHLIDRHQVIAIDLPGHGRSSTAPPAETDYSVAGLAQAVAAALGALGISSAVLIGHSLGGATALRVALDRPRLVAGLVLVASAGLGPEINDELIENVQSRPSRDQARRLLQLFFHNQRYVLDAAVGEIHTSRLNPATNAAVQAVASASFAHAGQQIGLAHRLGEVRPPTLIVWGAEDRVIPRAHAFSAALTIPDAWLKVMPGVGHVPHIEDAPGFARAIGRFARAIDA